MNRIFKCIYTFIVVFDNLKTVDAVDAPTLALFIHNNSALQLYQKDYNEDSAALPSSALNTTANDNDVRITGWYEATS